MTAASASGARDLRGYQPSPLSVVYGDNTPNKSSLLERKLRAAWDFSEIFL